MLHELATRGLATLEASGGGDEALEYALSALSQLPADDELLDAVVRFARGTDRHDDVYVALDRRKKAAQSDAERFGVVLRAAQTAAIRRYTPALSAPASSSRSRAKSRSFHRSLRDRSVCQAASMSRSFGAISARRWYTSRASSTRLSRSASRSARRRMYARATEAS